MGVDPQCFLVLFGRLSVVVVVGVSRGEVEAQFRRIGPGGNSVPKEGNRVSIIARLCIRFRQGYLHFEREVWPGRIDRKSTRLNSSHGYISYAVFCLKKKKIHLNAINTVNITSVTSIYHQTIP